MIRSTKSLYRLRWILSLLIITTTYVAQAQSSKYSAQNRNAYIDIVDEINLKKTSVIIPSDGDIRNYSTVFGSNSLRYIYTTQADSTKLNIISYFGRDKESKHDVRTLPEDFHGKEYSVVGFMDGQNPCMLMSTKGGKLVTAISIDGGENWEYCSCKSGELITSSAILYIHQDANGVYTAYFTGRGDLSGKGSRKNSVVYKMISYDKCKSWEHPVIAYKHNLNSLSGSCFFKMTSAKGLPGITKVKGDILYSLSKCKKNGSVFYSVSDDEGITWSYPREIPQLYGTTNHQVSTYNGNLILLYTEDDKSDRLNSVYMFSSNKRQFENGKFKGSLYRIYEYTPKMKELHNNGRDFINILIYGNTNIIFSIASDWDGDNIYIKSMLLNLQRYYNK